MTLEALLLTAARLEDEGEIASPAPARYLRACLKTSLAHVRLSQQAAADRQLTRFVEALEAHVGRGVSRAAYCALKPGALVLLGFREPRSAPPWTDHRSVPRAD